MRLRTPITLIVLLVLVLGAGWYGWQQIDEGVRNPFDSTPCTDEQFAKGSTLRTRQVRVNVYNAGNVTGLADATLDRLRKHGFRRGEADNAPTGIRVPTVAIYDGEPGSAAVRLVRSQFMGAVDLRSKPDIEEGVDVVVGSEFRGVDGKAPRLLKVRDSEQMCVPSPQRPDSGDDADAARASGRAPAAS